MKRKTARANNTFLLGSLIMIVLVIIVVVLFLFAAFRRKHSNMRRKIIIHLHKAHGNKPVKPGICDLFHQTVIEHLWSEKARRLEVPLTINGVQTIACSTNQYGAVLTLDVVVAEFVTCYAKRNVINEHAWGVTDAEALIRVSGCFHKADFFNVCHNYRDFRQTGRSASPYRHE